MNGSEWHQAMVDKYADAIAAWVARTGRWPVVHLMFVTPEKATAFVELDAEDTAESVRRWVAPRGPTTAYPWAGGPEGDRTACVFWQLEGPCTAVVSGQRCEWSGSGTPARCTWHAVDVTALGPLGEDDPRVRWAVVVFKVIEPPPAGQRWAITASYGVSYWATDVEAEAHAAAERKRGAARGMAAVAIQLAGVNARTAEQLASLAQAAHERGRTTVV